MKTYIQPKYILKFITGVCFTAIMLNSCKTTKESRKERTKEGRKETTTTKRN